MQITNKTTVGEALPFIQMEHLDELLKKCDAIPMPKPIWSLTCGEFLQTLEDGYIHKFFDNPDELLVIAIGHLKTYKEDMEKLDKYLKLNEITETSEEKQAKRGVVFPTFAEDILLTVAEFFSLKSLEEAESVPFADYLIIQKRNSANAKFERNLQKQFKMKSKAKSGKRK